MVPLISGRSVECLWKLKLPDSQSSIPSVFIILSLINSDVASIFFDHGFLSNLVKVLQNPSRKVYIDIDKFRRMVDIVEPLIDPLGILGTQS